MVSKEVTKIIFFASLILTLLFNPINLVAETTTNSSETPTEISNMEENETTTDNDIDEIHPRDKTTERLQEKDERDQIVKKLTSLYKEEQRLIENRDYKTDEEKKNIDERLDEINTMIQKIDEENHKRDIPRVELDNLIVKQDIFEAKLFNSNIVKFVTSVGIDITSKEIQIGLNSILVNSKNINGIVGMIEEIMPKDTPWHVVYSGSAEVVSCNQMKCTPVIGGNYIKVQGEKPCSFGFQAKKGSHMGLDNSRSLC